MSPSTCESGQMREASPLSRRLVRFGAFELDARAGELWKAGGRVSLQDQPLKVLACLLERPGELVSREDLRQRLWPGDTFVDFEHGVNAAVKRLRETLGDSADTPRFIETLPRRGYRFIAPVERDEPNAVDASLPTAEEHEGIDAATQRAGQPKRWTGRLVGAGAVVLLVTVAFSAWLLSRTQRAPQPPMRVVPLTLLTGFEDGPTFSPDGTQVAFAWNGDTQDNWDIYVKMVGSADVRRLSTNPAVEVNPIWSPDHRQIAYLPPGQLPSPAHVFTVRVMSALGGSDRQLSDIPVLFGINWSPDGRYITAAHGPPTNAIYLIPLMGMARRARYSSRRREPVERPALSPDGRSLAYAACQEPILRRDCDVHLVGVDSTFAAQGPGRRLTRQVGWSAGGLSWSRDGQFVIYSVLHPPFSPLWRVGVDGRRPPERIGTAGINVLGPVIGVSGDLVFSRFVHG